MNKELLLQIFKAAYNRRSFIDNVLLPTVQGKVDGLAIYDEQGSQEVDLTASEEEYAKSAVKYGEFTTRDEIGRTVELYEVILHDHKQVERSRVGIAALIKKQIIGNNAVLVNFAYANPQNRSWRFSFVAHDAVFTDGEMVQAETNPKRYTYVFGEPDETYRTALERFFTLGHEYSITVESLKDAFGVEAMSKAFFDEYRDIHYNGFVDYLTRSNFKQSVFNGNEKAIRDFAKKLLGRIVFLYFIQKKGWLGASDGEYKDGDKNFMSNFYQKAGASESFYSVWLSKLFFDTLNNPRPNDTFEMPDGATVKIPYLNGGLFEKESNKHDYLTFPSDLFTDLFEFFDQYNFTIYEDSPEEHTVAVDPEMLGHIFENLLEDNKDKGAFYTPKEIVHYMTQESLIEYLHTQIPAANRDELEAFVKSKDNRLSVAHKKQIDQKLDTVRICDPAIGSGAFPMGLLQEIFGMKERIAFELDHTDWSPATVKEHIIQNSIYGVDIEQGAVDIARLRFWLSLIVDEDMPKALPNLDYKILVGNSLVSKFEDEIIEIDWNTDDTSGGLFGQELIAEKTKLLQTISDKQKEFFNADNYAKPKLASEIRKLKLDILAKQLELMIETKGAKKDSNSLVKPSKKQLEKYLETKGWKRTLSKIKILKTNNKPFSHFDWKLDFPEVLNPLAGNKIGFDIVIANPPYLGEKGNKEKFHDVKKSSLSKFYKSKMDLFYFFFHLAIDFAKPKAVITFITTNYYITADGALLLRKDFNSRTTPLKFVNFNEFKIFDSALGQHNLITFLQKDKENKSCKIANCNIPGIYKKGLLNNVLNWSSERTDYLEKEDVFEGDQFYIRISGSKLEPKSLLLENIALSKNRLSKILSINSGCDITASRVTNKHLKDFPNLTANFGEGVFVLSQSEISNLSLNSYESTLIKPYLKNSDISAFVYKESSDKLLYIDWEQREKDIPNLIRHMDSYRIITEDQKARYDEPTWPWYSIHRPREKEIFKSDCKILVPYRSKKNKFAFSKSEIYSSRDVFYLTAKGNTTCQEVKGCTVLLNSSLIYFWLYNRGKRKGDTLELYATPLSEIPIPEGVGKLSKFLEYQIILISSNERIHTDFENRFISEELMNVIDALVLEMYFPVEFKSKDIEIVKHVKELFVPIEDLSYEEKTEQIKDVYEQLREKKNPLRNQIKLMKIELKDLLNPILSV
jgi:hypothetical protein